MTLNRIIGIWSHRGYSFNVATKLQISGLAFRSFESFPGAKRKITASRRVARDSELLAQMLMGAVPKNSIIIYIYCTYNKTQLHLCVSSREAIIAARDWHDSSVVKTSDSQFRSCRCRATFLSPMCIYYNIFHYSNIIFHPSTRSGSWRQHAEAK